MRKNIIYDLFAIGIMHENENMSGVGTRLIEMSLLSVKVNTC